MFELQQKLNKLLLQYYLLDYTQGSKDGGYADFDDFRGMYQNGLEVMGTDVTAYGVTIGLLSKYEDEMYSVNPEVWQQLYDSCVSFLDNVVPYQYPDWPVNPF